MEPLAIRPYPKTWFSPVTGKQLEHTGIFAHMNLERQTHALHVAGFTEELPPQNIASFGVYLLGDHWTSANGRSMDRIGVNDV